MKFKKKRNIKWIILLAVLLIISAYIILDSAIRPAVFSLAEIKLKAIASRSVYDAAQKAFASTINYSDLVNIEKDAAGNIMSLSANASNINRLASEVSLSVQGEIASIGEQGIEIPIGTVIGGPLLNGRGPSIIVKEEPIGVVRTEFLTAFESAGINQTRHLIYLAVYVNMKVILANTVKQVDYTSRLLIADTVIVGGIPEQYMELNGPEGMQSLAPMVLIDNFSAESEK